jgi:prolyl-tRNA editing enzyme YbaK/EbsC (Cys-tRNA(Pro) deacylase)
MPLFGDIGSRPPPVSRYNWKRYCHFTSNLETMSLESVRKFFAEHAPDIAIIVTDASSATVVEAAAAHGVEPAQIAKTLSLRVGGRKVKDTFGGKASMLEAAEVEAITGHPVGGVCPFGLAAPLPIYCDISLKAYGEVVPAAGSRNSALRLAPARMAQLTGAEWVDVCKDAAARE